MLESVTALAVADCLAAYRNTLAFAGSSPLLDERLLWPLRVAQELHEFVYAARHLPRWTYAPDGAICAMFP
jgi:maltokinase